jgi:oligoribonuclease NrnB/cAMP/cGMP phosphodiesterase (DHH superfamily)
MPSPIVIYHADCMDGLAAAWAVTQAYRGAELHAAQYLDPPPPNCAGRDVIIVDFSYPREQVEEIHRVAKSLIILDHHKTAEEALKDLPYAVFDPKRSGAAMAWDHFNPGKPRPWKINYVQDRDLWTWALPNSNAVNAYIRTRVRTVEDFDELFPLDMPTREIDLGSMVLDAEASYVRETMKHAREGILRRSFADTVRPVPIVNAGTYCHSELLGELAKGADFAVGWFATARGTYRYSLRSDPQGLDVSAIAKLFGGGGHKHAAGFEVDQPVHTYV